jgi:hypothetical protein
VLLHLLLPPQSHVVCKVFSLNSSLDFFTYNTHLTGWDHWYNIDRTIH